MRLSGPAFTVQSPPANNLWLHRAIAEAREGDILVVHVSDHYEAGYWGEVMTVAAMSRGLGGLVIDGGVRDHDQLEELGFPVFSRGLCIRGTGKDPKPPGSLGEPIRIGDVSVCRGDLVVGDADGVVVIPAASADDVLEAAKQRVENESAILERLRNGETTLDIYGLARSE